MSNQKNDKKKNSSIRFLTAFFIIIAIGLICMGAITAVVDPFFQYHKPLEGFPYIIDNQLSQNPGMARHFEYDSVILGSSMTVNFNTVWFHDLMGTNTLKLCYNGAYPKDNANIMDIVRDEKKELKAIYLGIDHTSYCSYPDEVKYPIDAYLYDTNPINDVSYLFNKEVLLNYIMKPFVNHDLATDRTDIYAQWMNLTYSKEQALAGYTPSDPDSLPLPKDEFITRTKDNMDKNILPFIYAYPDADVYVFFPPYSMLFWQQELESGRLDAVFEEYTVIIETLLSCDNVSLYYFQDWHDTTDNLNLYADVIHYNRDVSYMMTEAMAQKTDLMTEDNYRNRLDDMKAYIESYDYDQLH